MHTILPVWNIVRCKFKLFCRFIVHKLKAKSKRGHGVHSPFVYNLIVNVFRDRKKHEPFAGIEDVRKMLISSGDTIKVNDMGAGSVFFKGDERAVSRIVRYSSTSRKKGELLYRLARYFGAKKILELGTSLGLGSMYLAAVSEDAEVWSIEGCPELAATAVKNISDAGFGNIRIIEGSFEEVLPSVIERMERVDFVFFDGDHRKQSLLWQFEQCLGKSTGETVFVFDDIHWSDEMEEAWSEITSHEKVTISIDLFICGIVFFRKGLPRQKFVLKY